MQRNPQIKVYTSKAGLDARLQASAILREEADTLARFREQQQRQRYYDVLDLRVERGYKPK